VRRHTLFLLHKYAGLGAGLVLALLALTGFFLDHENFDFLWRITVDDRWVPASMEAKKPRAVEAYRVNPGDPQQVLAGTRRGLYRSLDGGGSFELVLPRQVLALAAGPDWSLLLAATTRGLWSSEDGGRHWHPFALVGRPVTSVNFHGGFAWAVVDKRQLYRVDHRGREEALSWRPPAPSVLPRSVTLGRLVRDLHYGRGVVDGDASLLFNDFLAGVLFFLSLGGFVIWLKVRARRRRKGRGGSLRFWLKTHAHGSQLPLFLLVFVIFGVTGLFLDHAGLFRGVLRSVTLDTAWLPPVYRSLATDVWGFDFDGERYRIGNRLGVFSSTDLEHWVLESEGFAWRMKRLGDRLLVSGMGSPNRLLAEKGWVELEGTPHMPRDFYLEEGRVRAFSTRGDPPPLPKWNSTSLYHILLGLHDGELFWGQWVWLNDLAVIASLLLLYTGFLKWLHHRRRRRHPSGRRSSPQARHK